MCACVHACIGVRVGVGVWEGEASLIVELLRLMHALQLDAV